jgi:hypothetical protein
MRFPMTIKHTMRILAFVVAGALLSAIPLRAQDAAGAAQSVPPDVMKQLEALTKRVEQLEAELGRRTVATGNATTETSPLKTDGRAADGFAPTITPVSSSVPAQAMLVPAMTVPAMTAPAMTSSAQGDAAPPQPAKKEKIAPFSDWDWTPEIRADVTYTYDFNKPIDDSMGGSSELFRSNEIQLEQLGVGGDFHWDNVRARLLTQFGMYSTATVRNDPSYSKGQWNINDADRYLAEAYGGYHLNALNGINIDAGIFMSYIGLFSYYNFDNWAYQPSYVSSNTPWFFEGLRVQIFPNPHLKIEPWFINGWQSYGSSNTRKGLGGQIKWTPRPWVNVISNNYGLGHDDLYVPNRGRIHTDDSIEIKYFDKPGNFLDKMAFSFTGDMGCEFGPSQVTSTGTYLQGVGCHGDTRDPNSTGGDHFGPGINPKQSFIGFMIYDRTWFKKDTHGLTIGGGMINNPGRYLVLVPPINGETASSAAINSPYFGENPSDPFKAWDASLTYDYMPRQWLTFRWEYDFRHANVPYWTGHGGVTPPGSTGVPYTNNGYPQYYACLSGSPAQTSGSPLSLVQAQVACGGPAGSTSAVWFPDMRRSENLVDIDIMVKF